MLNALATSEQGKSPQFRLTKGVMDCSVWQQVTPFSCNNSGASAVVGEKVRLAALEHVRSHKEGLTRLLAEAAALQAEVLLPNMHLYLRNIAVHRLDQLLARHPGVQTFSDVPHLPIMKPFAAG
jgi:hypothetical protein